MKKQEIYLSLENLTDKQLDTVYELTEYQHSSKVYFKDRTYPFLVYTKAWTRTSNISDKKEIGFEEFKKLFSSPEQVTLENDKKELISLLKECWLILPVDTKKERKVFNKVHQALKKYL